MTAGPIDLVYAWCDDSDPAWRAKRMAVAEKLGVATDTAANGACRYRGGGTLRHSLRSAAKCAPWLRTVFVVVDDDQAIPGWPELRRANVRIVRHSEIIPAKWLPTFCIDTIEHHVRLIPGLADRFLYSNDDMFFWEDVDERFFFGADGMPVFRYGAKRPPAKDEVERTYRRGQDLADALVAEATGLKPGVRSPIGRLAHHNIDAYFRPTMDECYERFRERLEPVFAYPFRSERAVQRALYADYALATGRGHFRRATFNTAPSAPWWRRLLPSWADSLQMPSGRWRDAPSLFARFRPKLVCFNDGLATADCDFDWLAAFLESRFPEVGK